MKCNKCRGTGKFGKHGFCYRCRGAGTLTQADLKRFDRYLENRQTPDDDEDDEELTELYTLLKRQMAISKRIAALVYNRLGT